MKKETLACLLIWGLLTVTVARARAQEPTPAAGADSQEAEEVAPALQDSHDGEVQHVALAFKAVTQRTDRPLTALALSGGGQWGAFGAGFLKGWAKRPSDPRPDFDIVTGTSTGSLISTFAFLASSPCVKTPCETPTCGGKPCDQQIIDQYLAIKHDGDVYSGRFFLTLLWANSLTTRDQFRKRLEAAITSEMVRKVGEEATRGRVLLVGATDVLSGRFHYFDLTRTARVFYYAKSPAQQEKLRQEYIDKLMASSAIPVQFPPVWLQDSPRWRPSLYVDGGARRNVFLEGLARFAKEHGRDFKVYCLMNGARGVDRVKYENLNHGIKIKQMATRSVAILLDESTEGNLIRIYLELQQLKGQKGEAVFAGIPKDVAHDCGAKTSAQDANFSFEVMKCLSDAGERLAQDDMTPVWHTNPLDASPY